MKTEMKISFEAIAVLEDEVAYASSKEFNGLFQVNMSTGKCKYMSLFPNEGSGVMRLHCKAEFYQNKVFFIPSSAEYLSIFDLDKQEFHQVQLPNIKKQNNSYKPLFKFADSYILDGYLWMIPSTYPAIIKVNLQTEKNTVIDDWIPQNGFFFRKGSYLLDSKIYIPDNTSNRVFEIDTKQDNIKIYPVGENNKGCWSCNSDDAANIWFAPRYPGPIIKWNPNNNEIVEFDKYPAGYQHNNFLFSKVYMVDQTAYFIPAYGNMMIELDRDSGCLSNIYNEVFQNAINTEYLFETNAFLYLNVVYSDRSVGYKISKENNELIKEDYIFSEGIEQRSRDHVFSEKNRNTVMNESESFGLDEYLAGLLYE